MASTEILEMVYTDIVESIGYKTTVGPVDKSKVARRRAGEVTKLPSSRLARAAWRVAALLAPFAQPPPPPPPTALWFPRTFNKEGGSDARFCCTTSDPAFAGLQGGMIADKGGATYDTNGLCVNGVRDPDRQVPGLRGAKQTDGLGPCDAYSIFPPWPDKSYEQ